MNAASRREKAVKQKAAKGTQNIPQLMPCPFCNCPNVDASIGFLAVICANCGTLGPRASGMVKGEFSMTAFLKRVTKAWNTRIPSLPSLPSVPSSSIPGSQA